MNIEYIIKPQKGISLRHHELWAYRELFYFFTWRDIKVKYKQTVLGFLWAIVQPLLLMVIFTLIFKKLMGVPSDGIPYPVFVYSGLMLFTLFSSGLTGAGNSMVANAQIIKKIYFPRIIIPMSSILVSLFDFIMTFAVYIGLILYYGMDVSIAKLVLYVFIALIITITTTFGMGSLFAAMNVKYRDFRYVIPFITQSLMFLSPVIYPVSLFPYDWAKYIYAINPLTGAINLVRGVIINQMPEIELVLISCGSAVIIFFVGLLYFRKTEQFFADIA